MNPEGSAARCWRSLHLQRLSDSCQKTAIRLKRLSLRTGPVCALIFVVAIAMALFASRCDSGTVVIGYRYAEQALLINAGNGLGGYYAWPPGYPMLIALGVRFGLAPMTAAWVISVVSFGGAAALVFFITRRLANPFFGLIATGVFVFQVRNLVWANMAMQEMLLVFAMLSGMAMLQLWLSSGSTGWSRRSAALSVAAGAVLAAPFWVKYTGIVIPGVGVMAGAVVAVRHPERRIDALILCASTLCFMLPIPIRNLVFGGSLTAHLFGITPAYTFTSALSTLLRTIHTDWAGLVLLEHVSWEKLLVVTSIVLAVLTLAGARRIATMAISVVPLIYLLLFAFLESHMRIDVISTRFVLPTFAFFGISFAFLWSELSRCRLLTLKQSARLTGLLALVLVVILAMGARSAYSGVQLNKSNWSPETISYIEHNISPGTTIAVSRYGWQLRAETLDYKTIAIPFEDPGNANYSQAYGISTWTREEALETFLQRHVRFVVFFMGEGWRDMFLEKHLYGDYVESLLDSNSPLVMDAIYLSDGIILSLVDEDAIRYELEHINS